MHHSPNYAYMYVRNVWIIVGVCNSSMVETIYIYFKFQLHTYLSKYTEIFNQESERSVAKRRSISNSVCLSVCQDSTWTLCTLHSSYTRQLSLAMVFAIPQYIFSPLSSICKLLIVWLTINTLSLSHQTKKELEAGINDILNCYITIVFPTCLHPARKSTLIMHLIFI